VVETLHHVVAQTCPGQRITLLLHDWGCLYGYQFALRHPSLVSRIVGVDIGDAGSAAHQAELGLKAKLAVLAYQLWLALAWRLGGVLGDRMARAMAAAMRCPAQAQSIGAQMGYPYAVLWFGVRGGFGAARPFDPAVPMLYLYGQRKPFMFHSQAWVDALARRPGSRVVGLRTGHWVMLDKAEDFNAEVARWQEGGSLADRIETDGELSIGEICLETATAVREGGPWGQAFPEPTFDGRFAIRKTRVVGEKHLKMWVEVEGARRTFDAIAFNYFQGREAGAPVPAGAQLVYRLDVNEYQGERRLQLLVDHVLP